MLRLYQYPFPPQNYIAEELLLGTVLIYPTILPHITPFIKSEYFFLECNQIIYLHILTIYTQNKLYPLELLYRLSDTNNLYHIGGIYKIIDLMKQGQIFITSKNINVYTQELVEIIALNYMKRLMIQYGQNIIQLANIKKISNYKLYNKASSYLESTETKIPKNNITNFKSIIKNFLLNIQYPDYKQDTKKNIKKLKSINTGFQEIDQLITNLCSGDLIVIAGRPSMGKTSLAINIICNLLNKQNIGLCFFSLEMSKQQILNKFISIYCNIPTKHLTSNQFKYKEWQEIKNVCEKLLNNYIYINDYNDLSIDYIEYTSKLLKKENKNIQLIVIDYLQLIRTENENSNKNRVQELSYITRKLKLLAQFLKIPVIILSQLNRSIEMRQNKQPILSDLKESGCISNNHNLILKSQNRVSLNIKNFFIHDNNYYFFIKQYELINILQVFFKRYYQKIHIKINLKIEYLFHFHTRHKTYLTYNHKVLCHHEWEYLYHMTKRTCPLMINNWYIKNKIKTKIFMQYINNIKFKKYFITYDIQEKLISHFLLYPFLIVHNSIEQDADIVIMLYKNIQQDHSNNIIDIMISKNRNGPTGTCQLLFSSKNTKFTSIKDTFNNVI
uniref:DNA 5'-3' helicase n=1 Tax=Spermothamnion repens TaxID=31383 RepID=A0A4D6WXI2_9FLOR|nr:replication helicase subunit [Spermothamnion repens]